MNAAVTNLAIETLLTVIGPELIREVFKTYHLPFNDDYADLYEMQCHLRWYVYEGIIPEEAFFSCSLDIFDI